MALGTLGSTLNDELNRLANGGTYRDSDKMVDEALAAKQWANRENINPYSTDTVGILNEIAGLGLDKKNWLDFNGVCNYIAGTTGLPAAAALRQVYPTTDLLTSQSAYYIDAAAPTNWGSLGYVRLNGVAGNYLSVPDANNLDITGDIDLRARIAPDTWTPTTVQDVLAKYTTTGNQRSYRLSISTLGQIVLYWSNDGTAVLSATSTASVSFANGQPGWIRAVLDVNNGASGKDVLFYTSTDGTNWTQLGVTVTTAGTTSIFAGTGVVEIGSIALGTSGNLTGNVYRAQVLNGIGGTTVLDVNIATDFKASNEDTFTATTGQTVTVNGVDTIANLGAAGSLLPTTLGSSTAADSNDPKFLDFTGTNYVYLPGVNSNNMIVPNSAPLQITGDIDLRVRVAMDDWTPSAISCLIAKHNFSGTANSYGLLLLTTGALQFEWNDNTPASLLFSSSVAVPFADGQVGWVRVTMDVDNGAGGYDVKFYTSTDGTTWTQLGVTRTGVGTTVIQSTTLNVGIGDRPFGASFPVAGKVYRAQIFNGIDGTKVLDVDTSVITAGSATSFTAVTGQTVTINRSTSGRKTVAVTQPTWLFGTDDYMEVNNRYMSSGTYLYLPGVASNDASAPDATPIKITGDIDLRCKVALDDWTPAAESALIAKMNSGNLGYGFTVLPTTGRLRFYWSTTGSNQFYSDSTVSPTVVDGATLWVRTTFQVNNGASGNTATFYTSTDGTTWTQLGTSVVTAGVTSIFAATTTLRVGTAFAGNQYASRGKFFRAQVLNGINGTVAFDANFETSITSLNQASFTESSANAATVTINRSGSAYRSAGITTAGYLYPGATNTFAASATDFLKFGLTDSFTVIAAFRQWATTADKRIISTVGSGGGYTLSQQTSNRAYFQVTDTITFPSAVVNVTNGGLTTLTGVRNVTADTVAAYVNTTAPVSVNDNNTRSTSNLIDAFRIGNQTGAVYADMEFIAGAVFRTVLTTAQIRQISNYFANREVYL